MHWSKLGQVFCPDRVHPWMRSHAANAVAEHRQGDEFRIYFSCRDADNQSSVGWVDVDLDNPTRVIRVAEEPVIGPGRIGAFDDSGASMGWLVREGDRRYLYYLGWNLGVTVPWRNSIGLAISAAQNGPFERHSEAPVMDRSDIDPFSISYPCVLHDGDRWRMWYGSNLSWGRRETDMAHLIKYAESHDGIHWRPTGKVAVPFASADEYAISRPCVLSGPTGYRMWYCYRGERYRIGYAESSDGLEWTRHDALAGIAPSDKGWDSEMVEYPFVFSHRGEMYMLYSGNGYGRTGFGIAILDAH
jgi:predicted GH43/DUF377 family glycosyl hydrolase